MSANSERAFSRDAIERFLDRSWLQERIPAPALSGQRSALDLLDDWMLRHRTATLTTASATDVRALLSSSYWDTVSYQYEALLGLITRFYQSLLDCKVRADDPVETLIERELAAAARKRDSARPRAQKRHHRVLFSHPRAI